MSVEHYFVRWRGKVSGPFSADLLMAQAQSGQLTKHHSVSTDQSNWTPAGSLSWLFAPATASAVDPQFIQPNASSGPALDLAGPLVSKTPASQNADKWFYSIDDGKEIGPVTFDLLKQMADSGQLKPIDQVFKEGTAKWVEARTAVGLVFPRPLKRVEDLSLKSERRVVQNPNMRFCGACGDVMAKTALMCPHCGHADEKFKHAEIPKQRRYVSRENGRPQVQTVEQTSKTWKGMQLAGCAFILLGPVIAGIGIQLNRDWFNSQLKFVEVIYVGAAVSALGLCVGVYARLMAWWHHG